MRATIARLRLALGGAYTESQARLTVELALAVGEVAPNSYVEAELADGSTVSVTMGTVLSWAREEGVA